MTLHSKPEQDLSDFIDARLNGDTMPAETDLNRLADDLMTLTEDARMDDAFADDLKAQFEGAPRKLITFPDWGVSRMVAGILLALCGTLLLSAFTPQGRAFAAEVMALLFPREAEETRTITYVDYDETDITEYISIATFNARVDFDLREPSYLPSYMQFKRLDYLASRNVTSLWYNGNGFWIRVLQQPLADTERGLLWHAFEPYSIGYETELIDVSLPDNITGQYVQGMWAGSEEDGYTWDTGFSIFHLRWQDDTHIYELRFTGGSPDIDRQALLARIADSMIDSE